MLGSWTYRVPPTHQQPPPVVRIKYDILLWTVDIYLVAVFVYLRNILPTLLFLLLFALMLGVCLVSSVL